MKPIMGKLSCLTLAIALLSAFSACNLHHHDEESQQARDERTREQMANAAAKLKVETRIAAKQADQAAHQAGRELRAAAQGAKEGWNRQETGIVNVNAASKTQLEALPGVSARQCDQVIRHRPYDSTHDLVERGIISQDEYDRISARLTIR